MKGKYAYESAYFLGEEIDENIFEDGCKYRELYNRHKESLNAPTNSPFNKKADKLLELYDKSYEKSTPKRFRFAKVSPRRVASVRIKVALTLLDKIEDEYDVHPSMLSSDDYHRLDRSTQEIKDLVKSHVQNVHVPNIQKLVDHIMDLKTGSEIVDYLYHAAY